MSKPERIYNHDFSRRSVLKKQELKPIVASLEDNKRILPSIINYKKNQIFPPHDCKRQSVFHISQREMCRGIIITKPGTYKVIENLTYCPRRQFTGAIIIASSNVTIDLGKYELKQGNKTPNTYGIIIARDNKSVVITGKRNIAKIRNFTLAGIRLYGRTKYISLNNIIVKHDIPVQLTNEQIPTDCNDILQLSLTLGIAIGEGDTFGTHMIGTNKNNLVEQLTIKNITAEGATIGVQMIFTFGFKILNSIFTKNTYYGLLNGTGWVVPGDNEFGLTFPVGGNGTITDCRFEQNKGLNVDLSNPGDLFVFDFVSAVANYDVSNVTVDRCLVADNSNNGYIIAADHDAAQNITWTNSVITGTRSIFEPADGLHFSGSVMFTVGSCTGANYPLVQGFNITIKNCTATDGRSEESRAVGFLFAYVQGGHISGCNSSGHSGGVESAGYYIVGGLPGGQTSGVTLVNNTAERVGATGTGRASGYFIGNFCNDVVLKDNIANYNGTGAGITYGAGVLVRASDRDEELVMRNFDIDNITAKGNGNPFSSGSSGGIVIVNDNLNQALAIQNIAVEKSVSKFNNGYGVLMRGNITGGSINESEIYQNTFNGIDVAGNPNLVFVSRNTSALNGVNNYNGVAANNIVTGTINNLPANPGFLNVSIV